MCCETLEIPGSVSNKHLKGWGKWGMEGKALAQSLGVEMNGA